MRIEGQGARLKAFPVKQAAERCRVGCGGRWRLCVLPAPPHPCLDPPTPAHTWQREVRLE